MAFGQQLGPPATARQLQELVTLLNDAGHVDFRDARGPLGLTQRQAGGKFTRQEAEALIERLRSEAEGTSGPTVTVDHGPTRPDVGPTTVSGADQRVLRRLPTRSLVDELRRRGWDGDLPAG